MIKRVEKKSIIFGTIFLMIGVSMIPTYDANNKNILDHSPRTSPESHDPTLTLLATADISQIPQKTPSVSWDDTVIELMQQLDESLYLKYLQGLIAFGSRVTGTPACNDSASYIYNQFLEMGLETRYHKWDHFDLHGINIEATIKGTNPLSDEIYIICAHYDTVSSSPGADDDGSGVALVLSAAKLMSSFGFNHTVKFVAFSGEEEGLYGSYYYVLDAVENHANIAAVLNVDMIGFAPNKDDANKVVIYENEESFWITEYTKNVSMRYKDILNLEVIPGGYSGGSDHYYFWDAMYNALFYAEFNFNDYYHSYEDTIENMNLDYAIRISQLVLAMCTELSEITERYSPFTPEQPSGPTPGKINVEYNYSTNTTDQQQDQIYYLFDWGDNTNSGWIGPYESGFSAETSHKWNKRGSYLIKVKAKDIYGKESSWSDPLPIKMPDSFNKPIQQSLEELFQRFPNAFPLMQQFVGY